MVEKGVSRFNFWKIKNEPSSIRGPPGTFGTHRDFLNLKSMCKFYVKGESGPVGASRDQSVLVRTSQ